MADLADLTALDARDRLAAGEISAADLVEAELRRIAILEPRIGAFAHLDPASVRIAAAAADNHRAAGGDLGPLHGLTVGIKDVIDTADMPTENGTPIDAGRQPDEDAEVVRRLRAAGAIIMGKTVSTELASMHPGATRNPHDLSRTPGGSSSGSAAAVASAMVRLALGTQTNGSVIRPASFCGVIGFKPSFGLIPRTGVLPQAAWLDTIGVFARTVADVALLTEVLAGPDLSDPDASPSPPPALLDPALTDPPKPPVLAFVRGPAWDLGEPAMVAGITGLVRRLGRSCEEVTLPEMYRQALTAMHTLGRVGIARNYRRYLGGGDRLSAFIRGAIEEGLAISAVDFLAARDLQAALAAGLGPVFDRYDAIVTPSAPGEAPAIETTGNPAFNSLWTLCGLPAISLPLLRGPNGMPIGVQLVGRRDADAELLRTARWLRANDAQKV